MKFKTLTLLSLLMIFVSSICELEARGGRGGGGARRGGGAFRAGGAGRANVHRNYSRAPTMSRAQAYRPRPAQTARVQRPSVQRPQTINRPAQVARPVQRPDFKPQPGFNRPSQVISRPAQTVNRPAQVVKRPALTAAKPVQRVNRPNRGVVGDNSKNNTKQFLQNARNNKIDKGTLDQRRNAFQANRGDRDRHQRLEANRARDGIKGNWHNYNHWFSRDFFDSRHYHPVYWNNRVNWWRAATWTGLAGWLAWDYSTPVYYEDGYYPISTQDTYYTQPASTPVYNTSPVNTQPVADSNADITGDWYPLGVYAVGKNEQLAGNSFMFVQLAINKNGDLAGTYYNATTDQTRELVGSVDKNTQQAAWSLADNPNSPIISTGLYNLTQDMTDVAVDFPDGTAQTWVYVRMQQ